MKREIKFKAKRVDNGEWVYGDLISNQFYNRFTNVNSCSIVSMPEYGDCEEDFEFIEVHPETVCQFTGLKDKNGVDIYEGGILNVNFGDGLRFNHTNITVYFDDDYLQWCVKGGNITSVLTTPLSRYHNGEYEVTGNIHDK